MEHNKEDEIHFVTQDEIEEVKKELIQTAITEARRAVIRLLGGVISGAKVVNQESNSNVAVSTTVQQDDEVITNYALKCMNDMEGED